MDPILLWDLTASLGELTLRSGRRTKQKSRKRKQLTKFRAEHRPCLPATIPHVIVEGDRGTTRKQAARQKKKVRFAPTTVFRTKNRQSISKNPRKLRRFTNVRVLPLPDEGYELQLNGHESIWKRFWRKTGIYEFSVPLPQFYGVGNPTPDALHTTSRTRNDP